ncbi:MAG: PqqD family protein [Armatimonadetes bacterium]|nr:PqqD family protein [Armatimonadota bacterium]
MKGIGFAAHNATADPWSGEETYLSRQGFVFDPVRGLTFQMNATAGFIHGLLQDGVAIADIVEMIVRRYEVDSTTARADLDDFLGELRDAGLR